MTTGNIVRDYRTAGPWGGLIGRYYSKSWSGTDWAVLPKPQKPAVQVASVEGLSKSDRRRVLAAVHANNREVIRKLKAEWAFRKKLMVKRQRERRYEVHPYSCSIKETFHSPLRIVYKQNPGDDWSYRVNSTNEAWGPSTVVQLISWSSEDDYRLIEKLKAKVVGSTFNLGIFAGESHMALAMIFNAARRISSSMRAVKKGNLRRAIRELSPVDPRMSGKKRTAKSTSNLYLEWIYGLKPLISDLQEGAEMLAHMNSQPFTHKVRVSVKKTGEVRSASPSNASDSGYYYERKSLIANLSEVNVPQLIGLTDWRSIAWELTPWSFVADWAIPIGNYLSARGIASALTGTYINTTTSRVSVTGRTTKPFPPGFQLAAYQSSGDGDYCWKTTTVNRTISSSLKVPTPDIRPLGAIPSWQRAANAVALLIQQRVK